MKKSKKHNWIHACAHQQDAYPEPNNCCVTGFGRSCHQKTVVVVCAELAQASQLFEATPGEKEMVIKKTKKFPFVFF